MNRRFILIPHIKIHNANAMSSPYTIGFPAMTAWLGAVHALQRHLRRNGLPNIQFSKVGVSCHQFDLQTYKGKSDFVHSIIGTANPLDKDGERPAFIEEARCHLEVTLLIEYQEHNPNDNQKLFTLINQQLAQMKLASGDILPFKELTDNQLMVIDDDDEQEIKKLTRRLMPGYALKERRDLMIKSMQEGKDALDALLDYLKVMHRAEQQDDKVIWTNKRKEAGWLVPIAVGFQGISELGSALNQRDIETPHRFAESVVTLGEFIMPYRVKDIDEILWQYYYDAENNLYLCQTQNQQQSIANI